ncbi:MAG: type II toxin-antitoxin system RelE/ParE family toxin [Planctomycetota bacterium]
MARRAVVMHPEAVAEAAAAAAWYRGRSPAAATAFEHELERAMVQIAEHPDRWPSYVPGTRRFALRRFPFTVVYQHDSSTIQLLAVAHARRRPGYWRTR